MKITCGPLHDQRTASLILPTYQSRKIAVLISGGLDSAILYYMLLQENKNLDNLHEIVPFTILRKEGSKHFVKPVIAHVHACFDMPYIDPIVVGDNTLPEDQQVKSGLKDAWSAGFNLGYVGIIEQLPEHVLGWDKIPHLIYNQTHRFKTPLRTLKKSHVIDLIIKLNQSGLFYITHSCDIYEIGRCNKCNGCNERIWGFDQLGISDPGTI